MEILDPYKRLEEFRKRLEKMLDAFEKREIGILQATPSASMRAKKQKNSIVYEFDLPGFEKKDVNVYVDENGMLVVTAEKKGKKKEKKEDYFYAESFATSVRREVPLPGEVDPKKINAKMSNGVLVVEVPVKKQKVAKKKVTVK